MSLFLFLSLLLRGSQFGSRWWSLQPSAGGSFLASTEVPSGPVEGFRGCNRHYFITYM
jgi:hypothetical protein